MTSLLPLIFAAAFCPLHLLTVQLGCVRVLLPLSFFQMIFSLSQGGAADSELTTTRSSSEHRDARPAVLSFPARRSKTLSFKATSCIAPVPFVFLL